MRQRRCQTRRVRDVVRPDASETLSDRQSAISLVSLSSESSLLLLFIRNNVHCYCHPFATTDCPLFHLTKAVREASLVAAAHWSFIHVAAVLLLNKGDVHCRYQEFNEGDLLMLRQLAERLPPGTWKKVHAKRMNPFNVQNKISANAYELDLSSNMGISLVFNVEDLTPCHGPSELTSSSTSTSPSLSPVSPTSDEPIDISSFRGVRTQVKDQVMSSVTCISASDKLGVLMHETVPLSPPSDVKGDKRNEEDPGDEQEMTTLSHHRFGNRNSIDALSITIIENMKEEYGLFVWPCSIILAEYVWQQRARFAGATVLEVGAGTSLPGLVAAKVGSDVTLTDDSNRLEVLANMRRVSDLNNLNCKVLGLTWGLWDAPIFNLHPNIILGADVLYDTIAFDDLFATVTFLLQNSPGSVFITTYHNRSGHHLIEFLMLKWGLKCEKLLDGFSFMPSCKACTFSGNIQLAEITLSGS